MNCESLPLEDTTRLQLVGLGGQEARTFWKCRSPEKGTGPRLHSTPGQTVTPGFARDCAQEAQVSPAEIYLKTEGVGRRARTPSVQTLGQAIGVILFKGGGENVKPPPLDSADCDTPTIGPWLGPPC